MAAELLAQVLKRTPHSADAEYQLGRAQAQMGNVDAAVTNFQAAVTDSGKSRHRDFAPVLLPAGTTLSAPAKAGKIRAALDSFMRLKQQADAQQSQNLQDKLRRSAQLQQAAPSQ